MGVLVDPAESLPPSNGEGLARLDRALFRKGLTPLRFHWDPSKPLPEVEAILIRTTTSHDGVAHRLARMAQSRGMAVIDDPMSIEICCDKRAVLRLLDENGVPHPLTLEADSSSLTAAAERIGYPCVLKALDGCACRGVKRVTEPRSLAAAFRTLCPQGGCLLVQPYLPTPFDWRIGVLEGRPIYACRYHMLAGYWQIIRWRNRRTPEHGEVEALPIGEAPKAVLQAALRAADAIGDGLYGIDVKELRSEVLVIDVNDNPTLDADCEDAVEGEQLYDRIAAVLAKRVRRAVRADGS